MSDTKPKTKAEQANWYIFCRVIEDRNFSYYLIGTHALELVLEAEAVRRSMTYMEIEAELFAKMDARDEACAARPTEAEVITLRNKNVQLEESLFELKGENRRLEDSLLDLKTHLAKGMKGANAP